ESRADLAVFLPWARRPATSSFDDSAASLRAETVAQRDRFTHVLRDARVGKEANYLVFRRDGDRALVGCIGIHPLPPFPAGYDDDGYPAHPPPPPPPTGSSDSDDIAGDDGVQDGGARPPPPPPPRAWHIGYWTRSSAAGNGYAPEAAAALAAIALAPLMPAPPGSPAVGLGLPAVVVWTNPDNARSARAARRAGFRPVGRRWLRHNAFYERFDMVAGVDSVPPFPAAVEFAL
ncbi:hypothetical protein HK405_014495, partial [Cladochytrium tenue]